MDYRDHYSHKEVREIFNKIDSEKKGISPKALACILRELPEEYKLYINGEKCVGVVYTSNKEGYYINLISE